MKTATMIIVGAMVLLFTGCALMNKLAPSQVDEQGVSVPGTHTLTPTAKTVVDITGPYGQAAAAIPLLIWNFVELVRAKKSEKGLIATIKALKQAGEDPLTQAAFEQIKTYLANAHDAANVKPLIDGILAKLK